MSAPAEEQRRARLTCAALTVTGTAAVAALGLAAPHHPPPATTSAARDTTQAPAADPPTAARLRPPAPLHGGPDLATTPPRHARVAARRFLAAFLRYELGDVSPTVRRQLRATATPRLARELLHAPPRLPAERRLRPATVVALEPLGADRTLAEFQALLRRPGAAPAVVTIMVDLRRGRPAVSALR